MKTYTELAELNTDELRNELEALAVSDNLYISKYDLSRSGLSCKARLYYVNNNNKIEDLTWLINRTMFNKKENFITIKGGGMSKTLILTYNMLGLKSQRITEL